LLLGDAKGVVDMNDSIKQMIRALIQRGLATPYTLQGCPNEEIEKLEEHFNIKLPDAYRDFLLTMGRGAGKLFEGSHFTYEHLFKLREWAEELMVEAKAEFDLPDDAFVFMMHQGYDFFFFQVSEGVDPPVDEFLEGKQVPTQQAEHLSEFLLTSARRWPRSVWELMNQRT
jgi:hypothetical protein